MFTSTAHHQKIDLVNLLFSLHDVDCPFKRSTDGCFLHRQTPMSKQERYSWLQAKEMVELERLYLRHCRCAQCR